MSKLTTLPEPTISVKVTKEEALLLKAYRQQRESSVMSIKERIHDLTELFHELTLLSKEVHFTTHGKSIVWEWFYILFYIDNGGHR